MTRPAKQRYKTHAMTKEPLPDFRSIMELWPSRAEFARDVGMSEAMAGQAYRTNSIHARWYQDIIRAAHKRDIEGLTLDLLVTLSKRRAERGPAPPLAKKKTEEAAA